MKYEPNTYDPNNTQYHSDLRKRANSRLRILETKYSETGHRYNEYSFKYQQLKEASKTKGFVNFEDGKLRFANDQEFAAMTNEEKIEYNKELWSFLSSDSSHVYGIDVGADENYKHLDEKYGLKERGITNDYAKEIIRVYNSQIAPNNQTHYGSDIILIALEETDWDEINKLKRDVGTNAALREVEKIMMYMNADRWSEIPDSMLKHKNRRI